MISLARCGSAASVVVILSIRVATKAAPFVLLSWTVAAFSLRRGSPADFSAGLGESIALRGCGPPPNTTDATSTGGVDELREAGMMWLAIAWLGCLALFLELAHRAPEDNSHGRS